MTGPVDWDGLVIGPLEAIFGEAATYSPVGLTPFPIIGVFDRAYRELNILDDGSSINTFMPVLGVQVSQFVQTPAVNDRVTVASMGKTYIVRDVRSDGHGWAKLMLNLAQVQP